MGRVLEATEAECGTPAGANRHRDLGEPVCESCTRALAKYRRRLRAQSNGRDGMRELDCDDLGFPNQWELPLGIRNAPDRAWTVHAACKDKPQHWWYPEDGTSPEAREAKAICAECPVREQCLEHAITNNENHGIWGGTSARERARIRRATRGAA